MENTLNKNFMTVPEVKLVWQVILGILNKNSRHCTVVPVSAGILPVATLILSQYGIFLLPDSIK